MVVGVTRVEIFLPEQHSLKDKRQVTKKIIEKTRTKFNISIIEINTTNLWQRVTVAFSVVGVNTNHVTTAIEKIVDYLESLYLGEVIDTKTEIIVMGNAV